MLVKKGTLGLLLVGKIVMLMGCKIVKMKQETLKFWSPVTALKLWSPVRACHHIPQQPTRVLDVRTGSNPDSKLTN